MRSRTHTSKKIRRTYRFPACVLVLLLAAICLPPAVEASTAAGEAPGSSSPPRSLSLDEARDLALGSDEQLAQMEQAVLGARADLMSAKSGRLPQLSLGGAWNRNLKKPAFFIPADMAAGFGGVTSVEMGGDWDMQAAATLSLNLWTSGRLSAARGMADEALEATLWRRALVRDAVVFTVETAYSDVLLARAELEIAEGALKLSGESLRVTRAGFEQRRPSWRPATTWSRRRSSCCASAAWRPGRASN